MHGLVCNRRLRALALGAVLTLAVSPTVAGAAPGAQFSVVTASGPARAPYFIFNGGPGATLTGEVRVSNTGRGAGQALLYPVDATTGQTSGAVYLGRDAARRGVGAWITLARPSVLLAPGRSARIAFRVRLPARVTPGDHLGGIVAEDATLRTGGSVRRGKGSFHINVRDLTVIAVQVEVPGPRTAQVSVNRMSTTGASGYQSLLIGLGNGGNTMLKPQGRVIVTDAAGRRVVDTTFLMDTFLPQTAIDYPVAVHGRALPAGNYCAAVALHYAGRRTLREPCFTISSRQAQQVFKAPGTLAPPAGGSSSLSPAVIAALGVLAGLLGAAALMRFRRPPPPVAITQSAPAVSPQPTLQASPAPAIQASEVEPPVAQRAPDPPQASPHDRGR
jgi:hypothetical protein